jgi:hypothetical protein
MDGSQRVSDWGGWEMTKGEGIIHEEGAIGEWGMEMKSVDCSGRVSDWGRWEIMNIVKGKRTDTSMASFVLGVHTYGREIGTLYEERGLMHNGCLNIYISFVLSCNIHLSSSLLFVQPLMEACYPLPDRALICVTSLWMIRFVCMTPTQDRTQSNCLLNAI